LRLFSFGGYGLALAALALARFGAYDSYPEEATFKTERVEHNFIEAPLSSDKADIKMNTYAP